MKRVGAITHPCTDGERLYFSPIDEDSCRQNSKRCDFPVVGLHVRLDPTGRRQVAGRGAAAPVARHSRHPLGQPLPVPHAPVPDEELRRLLGTSDPAPHQPRERPDVRLPRRLRRVTAHAQRRLSPALPQLPASLRHEPCADDDQPGDEDAQEQGGGRRSQDVPADDRVGRP